MKGAIQALGLHGQPADTGYVGCFNEIFNNIAPSLQKAIVTQNFLHESFFVLHQKMIGVVNKNQSKKKPGKNPKIKKSLINQKKNNLFS